MIRVPTEVVKSRAQTSSYGPASRSSLSAARHVLRSDGLKGFYRGFGSTVAREVWCFVSLPVAATHLCIRQIPFTSIQFPLYELFKLQLARYLRRKQLAAYQASVCGSVAGGIAAALTTPLDVLKTRTMLDLRVRSLIATHLLRADSLSSLRIPRKSEYLAFSSGLWKYMRRKGRRRSLPASYHGRCGFLQVVPSSSVHMNGQYKA